LGRWLGLGIGAWITLETRYFTACVIVAIFVFVVLGQTVWT